MRALEVTSVSVLRNEYEIWKETHETEQKDAISSLHHKLVDHFIDMLHIYMNIAFDGFNVNK